MFTSTTDTAASSNADIIAAQVALSKKKSLGIGLLLTFMFGPLGIFYATIIGAIVMLLLNIVVAIFSLGLGLLVTPPINLAVTWLGIKMHNDKIDKAVLGSTRA